ncbi:MAG: hypothetical protein OEN56_14305 [Gemmatimonadota bacterium]|nr:hypothetical protein [Gemmatimonadota bacterium]
MRRTVTPLIGLVPLVGLALAPHPVRAQVPDSLIVVDTLGLQAIDSLGMNTMGDTLADPFAAAYSGPLPTAVAEQLDYLTEAYFDTPGGLGLIPAAMAEAEIATEHVRLAGREAFNLSNMTRHMAHVIHAIDPTEVGGGPGLGYGFKRAAEAAGAHVSQAMRAEGERPGVFDFHAPYMERAARSAAQRADEAIRLARQVQRATSASQGLGLVERLARAVRAMAYGEDRDGDGRIGYSDDEIGLAQAEYHLAIVRRLAY